MTSTVFVSTHSTTHHVLAGFEFSPREVAGILAFFAVLAVLALCYFAAFVASLVSSAQRLHRAGRLRHPALAVACPILALLLVYPTWATRAAPLLVVGALVFGYAVMWRSGHGWFRWTAVAVLPWLVALAGAR